MNNNQAAGSSKKSRRARFRELLPSFARGRSRASSRATSPIPGKGIADDVPPPGAASASTLEIRPATHLDDGVIASTKAVTPTLTITLDDNLDDSSERGQDAEQDTPDLARQYDTWKIAEDQLRQDKKKRKLLDAYYEILKSKLNEDLQPAGTSERRNQLCAFIVSESKNLQDPKNSGRVSQVLKQACGFIVASKHVVTAASAPCLPASIACAGMMLICSLCLQAESQRSLLRKGLDYVPGLIYRLTKIEKLYLSLGQHIDEQRMEAEIKEEFKSSMTTLCSRIIEFQAHGVCHLQKSAAIRALSDITKQDEWDSMLVAMKESEEIVLKYATIENFEDVRHIRQANEASNMAYDKSKHEQQIAARSQKITGFLKVLHEHAWPGGDGYEASKNRVDKPLKGTCQWFTGHDKFKAWNSLVDPKSRSPLLLLTAYPGCGKSVLSKHLIDTVLVQSSDRTVCYFFFKDDFEHQKSPVGALCTLLHQLLNTSELKDCTPPADSALRSFETMGKESFFGSISSLWKTFTQAALHAEAGEIICVLDALDECRSKDRNELIEAINEYYRTSRNQGSCILKFFLTSRPYGDIQSQFVSAWGQQLSEIRLAGEEDDVANDIAEEIKIVVNHRIDRICDTFHLPDQKRKLMKTNLGATPGRTYLWITLVFDDLLGNSSGVNRNYINKKHISKEYIENFVKNPPKNVDDAYGRILNRSANEGGADQDLKKTQTILQMVLAARRPLTLEEISVALLFTEYQPPYEYRADEIETEDGIWDTIRDCCGLLVIRVDNKLYLLHQTVREYLVATSPEHNVENQKGRDTVQDGMIVSISYHGWKQSIDLENAHSVLAETCVSYIHSNFCVTNESLLEYSAMYWADHYRQSGRNCQTVLAEKTRDLCLQRGPYKQWINVYRKRVGRFVLPRGGPPWCLASALGLKNPVELFLNGCGSDIENDADLGDEENRTSLSWAAHNGHETVVQLLLGLNSVNPDSPDSLYGQTPLSYAAEYGHELVVQLLLNTGKVNPDSPDKSGRTPLSHAAQYGHELVVQLLLNTEKVNPDSPDKSGQTPLSHAAQYGHELVVQLLLDTGKVDVNSKDDQGRTALDLATEGGHEGVIQLLESFISSIPA